MDAKDGGFFCSIFRGEVSNMSWILNLVLLIKGWEKPCLFKKSMLWTECRQEEVLSYHANSRDSLEDEIGMEAFMTQTDPWWFFFQLVNSADNQGPCEIVVPQGTILEGRHILWQAVKRCSAIFPVSFLVCTVDLQCSNFGINVFI